MNRFMLIMVLTVLVGCLKTRAELEAEETGQQQQKVTVAQRQAAHKEQKDGVVVKEKAPPSAYRFEEIDEQMRQLNGRVETLENQMNQLASGKGSEKETVAKDKAAIEQKFVAYEEALRKIETMVIGLNDEVAKLKAPPPEPVATPGAKGKSSLEVADEQFAAKKWKEAITGFQKYREQNPKGKLFADATYKIGVCFQELGMKEEAKAFLEEVTAKYPTSKEAKKATARMKQLK